MLKRWRRDLNSALVFKQKHIVNRKTLVSNEKRNVFLSPKCFRRLAGGGFASKWKKRYHTDTLPWEKTLKSAVTHCHHQRSKKLKMCPHCKHTKHQVWVFTQPFCQMISKQLAGYSWLTLPNSLMAFLAYRREAVSLTGFPEAYGRTEMSH